jgi:serine/threonine protein kinase
MLRRKTGVGTAAFSFRPNLSKVLTLAAGRCLKKQELLDDVAVYSERSDLFALGCTMYEVFNRKHAYDSWARDSVPSMSFAAQREYGSRLCSLVTSLMAYSAGKRPGTQQLVDSLEAYCVSRWEKQKASMLWESLAVVSKGTPAAAMGGRSGQPATGMGPPSLPPWEQQQQPRQNFQLPPALQAIGQQQRQQQPPMMPPALLQARQAHQVHQQRVTALRQVQAQAALEQQKRQQQQQQFGGAQPAWNQTRKI